MVTKRLPWTEEDTTRLLQLVDQGVSAARAGAMLKRSMSAVQNHARKQGKPFPSVLSVRKAINAKIEEAERKR